MPFNLYNAIAAALWATTAFTGFMTLMLALGFVHIDFGRLLGGIFMPKIDRNAATVGLLMHLAVGVIFGLVYAGLFAYLGLSGVLWLAAFVGTGFGIYHWLLSMPLISIGRKLNPHIREGQEADPGIWGIHYGPQEAFVRLIGHFLYGAVMGFSYVAIAMLNGSIHGEAYGGNGSAILLALILYGAVTYLYLTTVPSQAATAHFAFEATEPAERELIRAGRAELRARYERGEITWDEYQHLRRQYASEP
ncbi:MAG TPA: hypothetical protein V6D00_05410 [Pantanalinema sp.]